MTHVFESKDAQTLYTEAHKVYLDNWETKTRFAETGCQWNSDIQHRTHTAIEDLSSSLETTNLMLQNAMQRIEELESRLKQLLR